jgi:hypothetical protein
MWGKYCRIYPEFARERENNTALFKVPYNKYTKIDCFIAQDKIYYSGKLICVQQIWFPLFQYSGPVENCSGPVDSWCSLVPDQWTFGKFVNPWTCNWYLFFSELTSNFVDKEPTCPKLWLCLQDFIWDSLDFDPQLLNNSCFMKSIMQSQVVSIQSYLVNFYCSNNYRSHD